MKKKILGLAIVAMVATLIAGGSYAYLQSTTTEKTNSFTMAAGITGEIAEPYWDGVGFSDETVSSDPLNNTGKKAAANFAPDMAIAKNPMVKNTSDSTTGYVAVKITYGNGITSYNQLSNFADINFNETNWEFNADKTVAYYKTPLAATQKTEPVFTSVKIKSTATETTMKNFDIVVKGFICQTGIEGVTTPKDTLIKAFGDILK